MTDDRPPRSDAALAAAMRRGEPAAFREFLLRFAPLLDHRARLLGVPPAEREDCVMEVLGDAAARLALPDAALPRSLAAYLATALRNHVLNTRRAEARRLRHHDDGAVADDAPRLDGGAERGAVVVVALCSEDAARASRGPAWEPAALPPALARLAAALEAQLDDVERSLLVWASHHVPHREIAAWLGVSHVAVTKRLERLRLRLRAAALRYADALPPGERVELQRFFRRAGLAADRAPGPAAAGVRPTANTGNTGHEVESHGRS